MNFLWSMAIVAFPVQSKCVILEDVGQIYKISRPITDNSGDMTPLAPLHLLTCNGLMLDVSMMEEKLRRDPKQINARCLVKERDGEEYDYTPLHLATRAGHLRCMIFLLQKDPLRERTADVNATYGPQGFNALALTKDSSCINMLLFNGITPDYNAPSYLESIEFPRTLYVNIACQCNNPLALSALLEHGATTLDEQFVDWELANDNTDAIFEEVPLCIACAIGATECVRLLLLHNTNIDIVLSMDPQKVPLLDHCLDRVLNCCDLNKGMQILKIFHAFGANFNVNSATIRRNSQESEMSSDFTKRSLIKELMRLAKEKLSNNSQRRLNVFRMHEDAQKYKKFVTDVLMKELETKKPLDKKQLNQKKREFKEFLLFQDLSAK